MDLPFGRHDLETVRGITYRLPSYRTGCGMPIRLRVALVFAPAPELRGLMRTHIQAPGLHWRLVTMEPASDPGLAPFTESLDVMGDGSLVLLPTPGCTAGSVSLLVRRGARPPLLLAGDLTDGAEAMPTPRGSPWWSPPGVGGRMVAWRHVWPARTQAGRSLGGGPAVRRRRLRWPVRWWRGGWPVG